MDVRVGTKGRLRAKNWCFQTVVLAKTLKSPLDSKIKPVNPKEHQPWIFIGRTDAKAEVPILWPPEVKNQLTGKDTDAGKDWGQEEKGVTGNKMVGWHHQFSGHEFEQTPIVKDKEARHAAVHRVTKSWIWLSDWQQIKISVVCFCFYKNRKSHSKIHKNFKGLLMAKIVKNKQTNKQGLRTSSSWLYNLLQG